MQLAVKPQRAKMLLSLEMTTQMAEVSSVGSGFQISDSELHHIKEILQTTQVSGFLPPGPTRFMVTRSAETTESCFLIIVSEILLFHCRTERLLHLTATKYWDKDQVETWHRGRKLNC